MMKTMLAAMGLLISATTMAGSMWQCEGYVLTDRPWDYAGCTEVGTGRVYGAEAPSAGRQERSRSTAAGNDRWFVGGTLHQATVRDWQRASERNKVATCGDWLSGTEWKGRLRTPQDFERLHAAARSLAVAVDEVVAGDVRKVPEMRVMEIAAALVSLSDEFGP